MLKLKLQTFSHLLQRANSLEKKKKPKQTVDAGKDERQKEKSVTEDEMIR